MAKDPAFLFYPSDWDGGTKLFDRHTKGAYMDLLIAQFNCGHMTSHDVAHVLGQRDFDNLWENKLKNKFIKDNEGKFFNQRLEDEQVKRKKWCESRNNNRGGKNQHIGHMTSHMSGHMENRNRNENRNKKDRGKGERKQFIKPTLEQVKAYCKETNSSIDPELFWHNYESSAWFKANGQKVINWKSTIKTWEKRENKQSVVTKLELEGRL